MFHHRLADALKGLVHLIRSEPNARIHLVATAGVLVLASLLHVGMAEFLWLLLAIAAVWSTELLNSALERLADRISPDRDPLIGRAKDMGAASVLVAALFALAVGLAIFVPKLIP